MVRRIWNLGIRTIGTMIPPCGFKSFLYKLSGIKMGKKVHISPGVYIADGYRKNLVELQDYCVLSPRVTLVPSSHPNTSFLGEVWDISLKAPIKIGRGVWIGAGAVILPGVTIGDGAIIGANAVVNKDVPAFAISVGIPSATIGDVREKKVISEEKKKEWSERLGIPL